MTLDGFDAGNIISDEVFFNKGTMSAAQIDSFFKSKVSSCQPGYTCLKDFRMNTPTRPADKYCNGYTGGQGESAATIIYKASQSCGINPQVFIVMLQKEQGLITHTWPSQWRFDMALGQGCPDDAPCDPQFAGFFYQIYGAARQMKIYTEGYWFQWFAPGNTWNIQYHPNKGCGTAPVYIANSATAALYYYTPYQPNAAAMRAGYGEGDACSSYGNRNFYNYFTDWFGPTHGGADKNSPVGFVDATGSGPGEITIAGWALDPDTSAPIDVHVYVGNAGYAVKADRPRPDLAPHYPGLGTSHGFEAKVPAQSWGNVNVCVYGINVSAGANRLLGCTTVHSYAGSPQGAVDGIEVGPGTVSVRGWALDPDTKDPIDVHVYVGGAGHPTTADVPRSDIGTAYPAYGPNHGYLKTVPASAGPQTVCVYGINTKVGNNKLLAGCQQVFVPPAQDPGTPPVGRLDETVIKADQVTLRGWTLDPDTASSTEVHVYIGGVGTAHTAADERKDIAAAYPGYGAAHGFTVQRTLPPGGERVCVYGINNASGSHTVLGCQFLAPAASHTPFGNVESVVPVSGGVQVTGWALDPDTSEPIEVHAYVGGVGYRIKAETARPDVGAAFPAAGERHGFSAVVPAAGTARTVCLYAINDGVGDNPLIACRTF